MHNAPTHHTESSLYRATHITHTQLHTYKTHSKYGFSCLIIFTLVLHVDFYAKKPQTQTIDVREDMNNWIYKYKSADSSISGFDSLLYSTYVFFVQAVLMYLYRHEN